MIRFSLVSLRDRSIRPAAVLIASAGLLGFAAVAVAALPPVPTPAENPFSEQKRVLGKILFFDEQLSTTNAVSCATCHVMGRAGTDPRVARNPGIDGILNSPDDILASPGVVLADADADYQPSAVFGFNPQITGRAANSALNAAYATDLFWDGRARSQYIDPQTGQVAIASGGALESQASGPPVNSVEMAHAGMDWATLSARLATKRPLDLASNMPADVAAALADKPSYQTLFQRAFGDGQITAKRIAFAIATYERTLISDQTPWDSFIAGNTAALTPQQQQGWVEFQNRSCNACHTAPLFSDNSFRNIGLRPIAEDNGRQSVTNNNADRGKFKVPSLRNAGLKATFMHNGQFNTLPQVLGFYAGAAAVPPNAPIRDNRDPLLNTINLPPQVSNVIVDFITNGLRDPRVASQTFPFDRATLYTERLADRPTVLTQTGVAGQGGIVPQILVNSPPMIGNTEFAVGLFSARPGVSASLGVSPNPPVNGRITPIAFVASMTTTGTGQGNGYATAHWTISPDHFASGQTLFMQWFITDAAAAGGQSASTVGRINAFCGSQGCIAPGCSPVDIAADNGMPLPAPLSTTNSGVNEGDYNAFFSGFFDAASWCDIATDAGKLLRRGGIDVNDSNSGVNEGDYNGFFMNFFNGCD